MPTREQVDLAERRIALMEHLQALGDDIRADAQKFCLADEAERLAYVAFLAYQHAAEAFWSDGSDDDRHYEYVGANEVREFIAAVSRGELPKLDWRDDER